MNNEWNSIGTSSGSFVEAGTLIINHHQALITRPVTVRDGATLAIGEGITYAPEQAIIFESGATFGGSGTYANPSTSGFISLPTNVTIAPGLSIGDLTINLNVGSVFALNSSTISYSSN